MVTEERGLARLGQNTPAMTMPTAAMVGGLSEEDFARSLEMLKTAAERVRMIQRTLMVDGRDYGTVPGTKKPTLLKPGAEVLALAYGYVLRVETFFTEGDGVRSPHIRYDATSYVHAGAWNGPIVAVGYGSCNTWETKYRYRTERATLVCPGCGNPGLIHTKARGSRPAGYWHPSDPNGYEPGSGCGENFPDDISPTRISGDRIENPDPYDLQNTILKMAEKRSVVDGVLRATGTSGLFTVEEEAGDRTKESPEARSRREFNDWVAETGMDPTDVMDLGKRLYPDRDLRRIAVWERTAWRAIAERDILYATAEQREAARNAPAGQTPAGAASPAAPTAPTAPTAAPAAPAQQPGEPVEANQRARAAATRAAAASAPPGPNGVGRSAEAVAEAARSAEAAPAGREWTLDELADIG